MHKILENIRILEGSSKFKNKAIYLESKSLRDLNANEELSDIPACKDNETVVFSTTEHNKKNRCSCRAQSLYKTEEWHYRVDAAQDHAPPEKLLIF